jgi:membrane peptidoglycan carboxypeptidase
VSSKADDFDVRYRDTGTAGDGQPAAGGGFRSSAGNVDYDLGYDAEGWDTQGFRIPDVDFLAGDGPANGPGNGQSHGPGHDAGGVGTAVRPDRDLNGGREESSHPPADAAETIQLNWEPQAACGLWPAGTPAQAGSGDGLGGPGGSRRPRGPWRFRGLSRPGLSRPGVKVKGSWWRHWTLGKALGVLLAAIGTLIVLGAIAVVVAYEKTPVPTAAMAATSYSQSVVYSENGTLIGRFGTTNRQMLTYDQIRQSKWLVDAVLAAEDRNFFNEGGISPTGIVRAAYEDVRGNDGSLQGGSTITQEFVRQYYSGIGTQQTLSRKIKEIFVAMKVAKEKSKPWILTNYLNTIYLGDGAYGIGAAAETYYNEPVKDLTAAQAAVIAAIIQQPSTYPLPQYRAQLEARWHYVLNGMVQMGSLSARQAATMKFPVPGDFVPQRVGNQVWDPYVLNMVFNELIDVYHFSQSQIYNGGYVIRTSIDDAKMAALYQAVSANEALMDSSGVPFDPTFMHAGAVLEDPATGAIQAIYPGPGYPGAKYDGTGKVITKSYCKKIACEVNMAVYNREQVGSSFKPYILATAVKQGMNVQTSTLNGYDNLCIAPDTQPMTYSVPTAPTCQAGWYPVHNDSTGENGPYTPQMAMAASINSAYADLWHRVAGTHGANVVSMAQAFGVNTDAAGITAGPTMEDQAGIALGQASLTVGEQATMLATIDDDGIYHDAHVITSISLGNNGPQTPIKITSYPVFSTDPTLNAEEASQVQYAMSEDTAPYGTAPTAGLSNGEEIIAKTGTTNTAQSAFFIGAIPSQSLAVALFTNQQGKGDQSLNGLGGNSQGGFGGTWPAAIWHTYGEAMFVPLGVEQFTPPTFTGAVWNQVPPDLRIVPTKHNKHHHGNQDGNNPGQGPGGGNPNPGGGQNGGGGGGQNGGGQNGGGQNGGPVGPAAGGLFGLPSTFLWVRRRRRDRKRD